MYLKSIEIQGFKSFPDRTLLTFSQGVSAIVGPNGSGKSNIADAIRWVMGEQSARTLRGGKMEDVIFGGTKRRSPMGFCEVSITVDNSDRSVALEVDDVTVTRRYYRSGDSDFFINRRPVRLRDVRELFMDTGLGQDGYSMIGQGRIDEILSVKSAERREIFEEASGISKVRHRKEESRRKLEQAEDNLVRIRDIITELEDRVKPLQRQAEKARRFLILRDELRVLEVSAALDSLDRLAEQIKTAKIDFDNAERLLSARKEELQQLREKSETLASQLRGKDEESEQARARMEAVREDLAGLQSLAAVAETNLRHAGDDRQAREAEAKAQQEKIDSLDTQISEKDRRSGEIDLMLERCRAQLEQLTEEIEEAGRQARDVISKIESRRARAALLRDQKQEKLAEIMARETALTEMSQRRDAGEEQRTRDGEKLQDQNRILAALDEQLEEARESRTSALNALNGASMIIDARRGRVEKAQAALDEARRELNARSDRLAMLEGMERDMEGFSGAVRRVVRAGSGLRGIHGPLSSLIEAEDRFSAAIETALGGAMQNIVVDDENSAKAAIGYLKANNLGRATFLPLTAIRPRWNSRRNLDREPGFCGYGSDLTSCDPIYKNIVSYFLGTTAVVDHIDSAIAMGKKYNYGFRIVTLDGQLINAGGAMTGGSLNKSVGVLSRANETRRLREALKELESGLAEKREAAEKASRELQAAEYRRRTADEDVRACDERIADMNARRSRVEAIAESLQSSLDALADEGRKADERMTSLKSEIEALRREADALEQEAAAESDEADRLSEESGRRSGGGQLEQRLTSVRLEIGRLESESASVEESRAMLDDLRQTAVREYEQKRRDAESAGADIERLRADLDGYTARSAALETERSELEKTVAALAESRRKLDEQKERTDRDVQARSDELLSHERERMRLDNRREQLEGEQTALLDRLWEAYELTPSTAREIYQEPADRQAAARRISELKAGIKALGSVNLDAIQEFEEVNERYTFMTAQRDDLEKAKTDLEQVISRLTATMEEAFASKFRQINESFGKTFAEIFGGGSAYLKLEDEKNILECGIDISVELPGKGRRAISLLSGGEKAFVATALYFAIIKVSPTPFCVMDEIDAALDEVNVGRFASYMRSLCERTQFIVITHRRGTMEHSDILYGVTMQEHGVTKLLKLDIREAESKLNIKLS